MVMSLQGLNVWNASTAFFSVRGILLPLFFTAYTDASPVYICSQSQVQM